MFTPFQVRDLRLRNRVVVSPMSMYSADDGLPNDWHLVHLGSRAVGGAGLVMAEMTDVSRAGAHLARLRWDVPPEHVAGWRRVVEFVHGGPVRRSRSSSATPGRKGSTRRLWEGDVPAPTGRQLAGGLRLADTLRPG